MDFIIFLVSKELSYKEIKKEDELNNINKPYYLTEYTCSKKDQSAKFFSPKNTNLNNTKKYNIKS